MADLFPQKILEKTVELFHPKTILDLGCGTGRALDYFVSKGLTCVGIEGSAVAIAKARNKNQIVQFDLNRELDLHRKFDLLWSFEFAEHIHPKYVSNLIKTLSNHSDTIVISAAHPGQGGDGHFNEQTEEYWTCQFARYGYRFSREKTQDLRNTNDLWSQNMYVFER